MSEFISAKNLKYLMDINGDKQTPLGREFGVSQPSMSAYLHSNTPIPPDILLKISDKYGVPVSDLINIDLSTEWDFPISITFNIDRAIDAVLICFPQRTSRKAQKDKSFIKAFEISREVYLEDVDTLDSRICIYEHAIDLYEKAWNESNTYVALINRISLILFIYSKFCPQNTNIDAELIKKDTFEAPEFQKILLRSSKSKNVVNKFNKKGKEFLNRYYNQVYENIKLLKSNSDFCELGDFFLLQCFLQGFIDEDIEYDTCKKAAELMMYQQIKLNNPYTVELIEVFLNIRISDIFQ